jgi:hypothetical protein
MENEDDFSTLARLRRAVDPLSTLKDLYTAYQGMNPDEPDPNRITPKTILTASDIGSDPEVLAARRQIADAQASGLIDSVSGGIGPAMGITKKTGTGFLSLVEPAAKDYGDVITKVQRDLGERMGRPPVDEGLEAALGRSEPAKHWFDEKIQRLEARFGDKQPKGGVIANIKPIEKDGALIIDTYGQGDIHNAPTTVGGEDVTKIKKDAWNRPMPFPTDFRKIEDAAKNFDGPIILGNKSDPFMWMDQKYEMTKNLLNSLEGKDITIRTRSDLVGHDDYIPLLKKNNTTVQMIVPERIVGLGNMEQAIRTLEPGAPSLERRLEAVQKLRENGINVEIVRRPYTQEQLKRAGLVE